MDLIEELAEADSMADALERHGVAESEEKQLRFYDYLHTTGAGLDERLEASNYASAGRYREAEKVLDGYR